MTTQADFDAFVRSQRGVRKLVLRDLEAWWKLNGHLTGDALMRAARLDLTTLAATYGDVSAAAAADFYEAARADSAARGRFSARLPKSEAAQAVSRNLGWALSGDDPFARLSKVLDEASLQDGRNAIMANAQRDPAKPRFARVPVGKTCAWCLMLGSRGAVYRSAESAGAGRQYHSNCDCQPVASWDRGADLPGSYDEGHFYGLYDRARSEAGSSNPKDVAAALRRLDGGKWAADGVKPSN